VLSKISVPKHKFERLANEFLGQIRANVLRPGDRLPSVRNLSCQKKLSVTTIRQAYQTLEDKGLIEARPQSGYYVRLQPMKEPLSFELKTSFIQAEPQTLQLEDLSRRVREDATLPELVQFGAAVPSPELLPSARLNNLLARLARSGQVPAHLLGSAQGCLGLRVQIARRLFLAGCNMSPEEILITNGCTEALHLALRAVCKPGDLVAIESPTYFGILQIIESLGLQVLEIPCHPTNGISLEILQSSIARFPVKAVIVVSNFNNPMGCVMSDENKRLLVEMLSKHKIPLIEDDLYGDLSFSDRRPVVARSFDHQGWVLLCSSYSKCISPGYRVGWLAPGRWKNEIETLKAATNLFSPLLPQLAVAKFLESGGYDFNLRRMRRAYELKTQKMADAVLRFFPIGTKVTSPAGGYVLWVQMPEAIDSFELYRRGLAFGITIAPGYLFAPSLRYFNYVRLNAAMFSNDTAWAVSRLGKIARTLISS
jgi:DNA-binding transcriptional MocR family regulator